MHALDLLKVCNEPTLEVGEGSNVCVANEWLSRRYVMLCYVLDVMSALNCCWF